MLQYKFNAKCWQHNASGGWHFVSIPIDISTEIRSQHKNFEEGWGRLKASAKIGLTQWKTSIWFDTKLNCYLLPLKAEVRKKEKIASENIISVTLLL